MKFKLNMAIKMIIFINILIVSKSLMNAQKLFSDVDCGKGKSCYRTSNCEFGKCEIAISWKTIKLNNEDYVEFELVGQMRSDDNQYVGIGFSNDTKMGQDGTIGCFIFNKKLGYSAGWNPKYYNKFVNHSEIDQDFLLDSSKTTIEQTSTGHLRCKLTRKAVSPSSLKDQVKDLSDNRYYLIWSIGKMTDAIHFSKHYPDSKKTYEGATINFHSDNNLNIIDQSKPVMVRLHATFMLIGWILFITNGIIIAKFYKSNWPKIFVLKAKLWFQLHRLIQMIGVLSVCVGFILIFVHVKAYSYFGSNSVDSCHPILGIISTVLLLTNPIIALCRCNPQDSRRWIFNWMHSLVGFAGYFLALICIVIGFQLPNNGGKLATLQFPWILALVMLVAMMALFVVGKIMERYNKHHRHEFELKEHEKSPSTVSESTSPMYLHLIIASICTTVIFTVVLLSILWSY